MGDLLSPPPRHGPLEPLGFQVKQSLTFVGTTPSPPLGSLALGPISALAFSSGMMEETRQSPAPARPPGSVILV